MKVLWFTNDPLPAVLRRLGHKTAGTGHWISSLLGHLKQVPEIQLTVATLYPGIQEDQFEEQGVNYFCLSQPRSAYEFFRAREKDLWRCTNVIDACSPDVIHIHGTERLYGLIPARYLTKRPCVISLQGLLGPYTKSFFGALAPLEILDSHRVSELVSGRGLLGLYRAFVMGAKREREILSSDCLFLGRTDWDRAHLLAVNSTARYETVGETLRKEFEQVTWRLNECNRNSVIFTNAGEPRRGTEVLLKAMHIVRGVLPNAKLRLAGHVGNRRGYERFLRRQIEHLELSDAVTFLGYLNAQELTEALAKAHVFAISSYLENSPNSLCEAMRVGIPAIAAFAGGMPSLLENNRTGLLFPAGDPALLAEAILKVFLDDELASNLSLAARIVAAERHDPRRVISQLLSAYRMATSGQQVLTDHAVVSKQIAIGSL